MSGTVIGRRHTGGGLRLRLRVRLLAQFLHANLVFLGFRVRREYLGVDEIACAFDAVELAHAGKVEVDGLRITQEIGALRVAQVLVYLVDGACELALASRTLRVFALVNTSNAASHCVEWCDGCGGRCRRRRGSVSKWRD